MESQEIDKFEFKELGVQIPQKIRYLNEEEPEVYEPPDNEHKLKF